MINQEEKIKEFEAIFAQLKASLYLSDEVMVRLNNKFFDSVSSSLIELEEAIATKDYNTIERLAHSIKGSASSLHYTTVCDTAHILEMKGHEQEEDGYKETLSELTEQFRTWQECYAIWKKKMGL